MSMGLTPYSMILERFPFTDKYLVFTVNLNSTKVWGEWCWGRHRNVKTPARAVALRFIRTSLADRRYFVADVIVDLFQRLPGAEFNE